MALTLERAGRPRNQRPSTFLTAGAAIWLIALLASSSTAGAAESSARARLFATLPDWTGLWETEARAEFSNHGKFPATPKLWDKPPYTEAAQENYAPEGFPLAGLENFFAVFNRRPRGEKDCQPAGFPGIAETLLEGGIFEWLVTPEETLLVASDGTLRHIYTDGRPHPKPEDLWPTPVGDSIGHWEGDTLVIDTIAREAGPIVHFTGAADLSERAHFIERVRRTGANTLEDQMIIDDPLRFTHPWHVTIRYARVSVLDRMIPTGCEHDRNTVGDEHGIAPPR